MIDLAILLTFLIFCVLATRKGWEFLQSSAREYRQNIAQELQEADDLVQQSTRALEQARLEASGISHQIKEIQDLAHKEIELMLQKNQEDIQKLRQHYKHILENHKQTLYRQWQKELMQQLWVHIKQQVDAEVARIPSHDLMQELCHDVQRLSVSIK